jgi:hypothetical protein
MLPAEIEFQRRDAEVDEYIQHLIALEASTGFSVSLANTMKSSALLMIYNLIESTMTNILQDVFDHLHTGKVSFDQLNTAMKRLVLSYAKKRNPASLVTRMEQDTLTLVVACFDRSELFSGNLDCQVIRETLKEIGVPTKHAYREPALLTVKTERNELAHGTKSFGDCGRNYTARQLNEFHQKTKVILQRVILDFDSFLEEKAYA